MSYDDTFYLKVPVSLEVREEVVRGMPHYINSTDYRQICGRLLPYFAEMPEHEMIGYCEIRVESFDLRVDYPNAQPWMCVAVREFDEISDETRMLLLMKFDMRDHRF